MVSNVAKTDAVFTCDGTLSSSDFRVAALAFAEKWNKFSSSTTSTIQRQWSWVPCPKHPWFAAHGAEGYLSLENVLLCCSTQEHIEKGSQGKEEASCSDQDDTVDDASLSYGDEVHCYDFHIVYSSSYCVPVLYFCAYHIDGQPLALDDIEKDLPANSAKVLVESKWTFITQEEHPYLNRPWYTLHPCGTSEWMKLLLIADPSHAKGGLTFEKYLASWFSVVGQVFDLRVPAQMLKRF